MAVNVKFKIVFLTFLNFYFIPFYVLPIEIVSTVICHVHEVCQQYIIYRYKLAIMTAIVKDIISIE